MPRPTRIFYVKYRWSDPNSKMSGIPERLCNTLNDAEEVLLKASREHDIFDVEVWAADIEDDQWQKYAWTPPHGGGLTEARNE